MKKFCIAMVAFLCSLISVQAANAGFLFVDVFDGTNTLNVVDGDANDLDGVVNNSINVNTGAGSAFLALFTQLIEGSQVSSTSNLADSFADGFSTLSTSFTLKGNGADAANFTITSGQTDFSVPGDPKYVNTSGSFTFTLSNALNASFQGSVGTTNGASDQFDTLVSKVSTNNTVNSSGGNGAGFGFSNGNSNYSIQNVLKGSLVATTGVTIQNQGTTTVDVPPVPEPSTIVLLATFAAPVAFGVYRRRKAAK